MGGVASELMTAAVCTGDGRIEARQVPVPVPAPDELLVEVSGCGICGSDLHLVFDRYVRPGAILGHEWSGTVARGGSSVPDRRDGQRVVFNPAPGCGVCRPCRRGRPSVCVRRGSADMRDMRGAFARFVTVPSANTLPVPDSLPSRTSALAEPTAIALHAVELAGVGAEDRVLITGGGPVGLLLTAVLRSRGVDDVTVCEPVALRRERALAVGAGCTLRPEDLDEPATGATVGAPYDVAFECSGRARAAELALGQLGRAGTLVFVGTGAGPVPVNHNRMILLELEALGTYNYSAEGFRPALDLLASGALPVGLLVEPEDVPLDGVMAAMERLSRGETAAKVLVRPGAS
jgi:2-desacetyl-2-hydroxyethyl bacteriochlorophyllide A dehydrogenase